MGITRTIQNIIERCKFYGLEMPEQQAYVLATVEWETNHTFKPVKEAYWLSEDWRKKHLRYYPYYGRGFVQLTWEENYKNLGKILNINLAQEPDLALDSEVATEILVYGFKHGTFTGKKLEKYVNEESVSFKKARKCINGSDKAKTIAAMAEGYLEKILNGRFQQNKSMKA